MSNIDPNILKMQYEILNVPLEQLSKEANIPLDILNTEAEKAGWKQFWPEEKYHTRFEKERKDVDESEESDEYSHQDLINQQSEEFINSSSQRLKVFSLAKELYLANKYLILEVTLLDRIKELIEGDGLDDLGVRDPAMLQKLSSIYKDLSSGSSISQLMKSAKDEKGGLPLFILKDLTGKELLE